MIPDEHDIYADDAVAVYESKNDGGEVVQHDIHFCYNTAVQSDPGEPKSFKRAMETSEKEWWSKAIISEINNFV